MLFSNASPLLVPPPRIHRFSAPSSHLPAEDLLFSAVLLQRETTKTVRMYEAGDLHVLTNYRPISPLAQCSKIH